LLIDADLRRGRLHRLFGCENRPGLSDILSEHKPVEGTYHTTFHENLTVLTCGKHVSEGAELLNTAEFSRLMKELRQKYQKIIVDSPPVLGLSETSILQTFSDGVLMVIWSGHTPLHNIQAAMQVLQANGTKFVGFVLNRLDFSMAPNYYKYFYYSYNYYENYQIAEKH
jgi:polysaccharide biosynthesis transport protein